ncbi:hypothetical protein PSH58_16745 [Pseudomonas hefeiensis]|uniref:Uncharacterized protein n=1 Tax=Pseudomonas hefeiensis TaxID=2738125 RepID=A0ABY9G4I6_9PSED|nr:MULTISPECIES: hypothetical protein [unclassified Pseudomonas]WLH10545.1 hypothetical protein PSH57_16730 [Pseudomonas sp. FP205]WLH93623.1 hypothetical protein PSH58_16745 [Pseudomonas sp. FP53]WLI37907.1 hypothetical protein PSH74_16680 [Pseudomonas sp. FP821]
MNAATHQLSFAPGNYVTASAFSTNGKEFPEFVATSRLIEKKKAGITRTEAVVITAIDREEKKTRATVTSTRELTISIPANFEPGSYELKTRDDVSFSFKASTTIYEGISGSIELIPTSEGNVRGNFNVDLELPEADGQTILLKGQFQVRKA